MVIGEALVQFKSDATQTISALKDVASAASDTNAKSVSALDQFKKSMGSSVDASQKFAKKFLEVGAVVGGAAVVFAKEAIDAYNEHNQVLAQMNAVLKSTGDASGLFASDLTDQAEAIQNLTGVSRNAVLAGSNMLQTFTNIKGPQFQGATQAVVDMATAMNGGAIPNMEQTREQALQLGKALNDPAKGMMMLRREGVTFSDDQQTAIKAMEKTGDTAGAQAIMLKELQKEFGGSAEAAGNTFAGNIAKAQNTIEDFKVSVADAIVKYLTPLLGKFNDWVNAMGGPQGVMDKMVATIASFITWGKQHMDIIALMAGAIGGPLVAAFVAWAVAAAVAAVETLIAMAPIILIGAAIAGLAYLIYTNWGSITTFLKSLWKTISDDAKGLVDGIIGFFQSIPKRVEDALKNLGSTIENSIKGGLSSITSQLKIPGFATGVSNFGGGMALVGENGPELVNLPKGSDVMTNADSASFMKSQATQGGGDTNVTNHNYDVKVGTFLGTPQEMRTFVEMINREQQRINRRS